MCRWLEDLGMTVGATVVAAMRDDAIAHAFCIATDAAGVLVQPIRTGDKQRRACARGHYLVQIADADHVFFEYLAKETRATIGALFRGFSGYIQADAKSVYDLLFRPPDQRPPPDDGELDTAIRLEVGCWAHYPESFVIWSRLPVAVDIRRRSLRIMRANLRPASASIEACLVFATLTPRDAREKAVIAIWRAGGLAWGTIAVYLGWVRRWRSHWQARGVDDTRQLTLAGVVSFVSMLIGPRRRRRIRPACRATARNGLHGWSCALRTLGEPVPCLRPSPPTRRPPPLR